MTARGHITSGVGGEVTGNVVPADGSGILAFLIGRAEKRIERRDDGFDHLVNLLIFIPALWMLRLAA
jgi:hypothetical protein